MLPKELDEKGIGIYKDCILIEEAGYNHALRLVKSKLPAIIDLVTKETEKRVIGSIIKLIEETKPVNINEFSDETETHFTYNDGERDFADDIIHTINHSITK